MRIPHYTEDGFSDVHQAFLEEHYHHFDDSEENKFIYTNIFKQYVRNISVSIVSLKFQSENNDCGMFKNLQTELIEGYLEKELQSRMPTFDMHTFLQSLE